MAKGKNKPLDEKPGDELSTLQAQHDVLAEEVLELRQLLKDQRQENRQLREEMEILRSLTATVANSVSIAPAPPAAPERPVVEIGGERYQFKVGTVRLSPRQVVQATQIADDPALLEEVFVKYPGLFKKL